MRKDIWLTPKAACAKLGAGWKVEQNKIVKRNEVGVVVASKRIFDGSEHILARANHVVF